MGYPREFAAAKWFLDAHADLYPAGTIAENGTEVEDRNHVADVWYIKPDKTRIAVGVRCWDPRAKHRDFRIRAHREGRPVEAAALKVGENTYDVYLNIWMPLENEPGEYIYVDVNAMRDAGLLNYTQPPWSQKPAWEGDGSMSMTESFYSISGEYLFEHDFAIRAYFYNRTKESDFIEKYAAADWPRVLLEKNA